MRNALDGRRVLITRPAGQSDDFVQRLEALGAVPVIYPLLEITPPDDPAPLDAALARLAAYDWLVFSSANAVEQVWRRLAGAGLGAEALRGRRLAAVGPATAAALAGRGLAVDVVPEEHVAEALVQALGEVAGRRILLPTADIAPTTLADGLRQKGAEVDRVTAYHTRPAAPPADLAAWLSGLDVLTFASSSAVRNFANLLNTGDPAAAIGRAVVACIGPKTARTARQLGLPVHVVPDDYTVPGLVEAIARYFETNHLQTRTSK